MKRLSSLLGVVAVIASLAGCVDFKKYTKEAGDLVSMYDPKIGELLTSSQALVDRAKGLPAESSDLVGRVTANNAKLTDLKAQIDNLPELIDGAVKAKDQKKVTSLLDAQKVALTDGMADGKKSLDGLTVEVADAEKKAEEAKAAKPAAASASGFTKTLGSGYALSGAATGIEAQLVAFIEDKGKPIDQTTWFNFDRLAFKTGSAVLDGEVSKPQLANIAEILKAYPKVKLKVGGYTDNQGPAAKNKKLSADRAKAVVTALTGMGVGAGRLAPEGYGAEHPVCAANDTEECRAQNRRIAVRVTAK